MTPIYYSFCPCTIFHTEGKFSLCAKIYIYFFTQTKCVNNGIIVGIGWKYFDMQGKHVCILNLFSLMF